MQICFIWILARVVELVRISKKEFQIVLSRKSLINNSGQLPNLIQNHVQVDNNRVHLNRDRIHWFPRYARTDEKEFGKWQIVHM